MMFGFGRKKKAPEWKDLSDAQKARVARKIAKGVKAQWYGPKYKLVSGSDVLQRERGLTEVFGED